MKKILLTMILSGGIAFGCFAQSSSDGTKFSIGIDAASPNGIASEVYNFGLGVSAKIDIPAGNNLYGTIGAGYEAFFTKSILKQYGAPSSSGFVPLKAGLKYYFNQGFYGEFQAGVSIATSEGGGTAFAYAPGFGYSTPSGFDVSFRYEAWSKDGTFGQVAARIAYRF